MFNTKITNNRNLVENKKNLEFSSATKETSDRPQDTKLPYVEDGIVSKIYTHQCKIV